MEIKCYESYGMPVLDGIATETDTNLEYKHKTVCECCGDYERCRKHCNLGNCDKLSL